MGGFREMAALLVKSYILGVRWAGRQRLLCLQQAIRYPGEEARLRARVLHLEDENYQLRSKNGLLQSRVGEAAVKKHYSPLQRLRILWHLEYFGIPRSRVKEHFGVSISTLYRWLRAAEKGELLKEKEKRESPCKTPVELVRLVWEVFSQNPYWGRHRMAMTLWALGIFMAASTVRNILLSPRPEQASPGAAKAAVGEPKQRQIVARYPNHVWSIDRTRVYRWRIWPTWVLVAIDHYSRKVVATVALEGPNGGWIANALEAAFRCHGAPKYVITDQEGVFTGGAFRELLQDWGIKPRFGAVGRHGSIAVTERVILTLKQEWLRRVPLIRDFDHLCQLLDGFVEFYNDWRGHLTLAGATPSLVHAGRSWHKPERHAKTIPLNMQRRLFPEVRVTAYRLAA